MNKNEGFINERTGAYVSPERARQHVGEEHAFGGYEKAQSKKTGNFYMREAGVGEASRPTREFQAVSTSFPGILSRDGRSGR